MEVTSSTEATPAVLVAGDDIRHFEVERIDRSAPQRDESSRRVLPTSRTKMPSFSRARRFNRMLDDDQREESTQLNVQAPAKAAVLLSRVLCASGAALFLFAVGSALMPREPASGGGGTGSTLPTRPPATAENRAVGNATSAPRLPMPSLPDNVVRSRPPSQPPPSQPPPAPSSPPPPPPPPPRTAPSPSPLPPMPSSLPPPPPPPPSPSAPPPGFPLIRCKDDATYSDDVWQCWNWAGYNCRDGHPPVNTPTRIERLIRSCPEACAGTRSTLRLSNALEAPVPSRHLPLACSSAQTNGRVSRANRRRPRPVPPAVASNPTRAAAATDPTGRAASSTITPQHGIPHERPVRCLHGRPR